MRIFRRDPRLFETGFFDQVEVRAEGDALVIEVTERPLVTTIEGNQAIKTEDLLDSLRAGIVEGDVLKRATLINWNKRSKTLHCVGRYDATVNSKLSSKTVIVLV